MRSKERHSGHADLVRIPWTPLQSWRTGAIPKGSSLMGEEDFSGASLLFCIEQFSYMSVPGNNLPRNKIEVSHDKLWRTKFYFIFLIKKREEDAGQFSVLPIPTFGAHDAMVFSLSFLSSWSLLSYFEKLTDTCGWLVTEGVCGSETLRPKSIPVVWTSGWQGQYLGEASRIGKQNRVLSKALEISPGRQLSG